MPRSRRLFISDQVYSLCFRVASGLPFVATNYMKTIIEGCMARVLENKHVQLNQFLWMGNHPHMILVAKDAEELAKFYGELQKKLTESVKALLGLKKLNLWEGRPTVALLGTLQDVKSQIVYLYANPMKANLVNRIEEYPGLSSYNEFKNVSNKIEEEVTMIGSWNPVESIPKLPKRSLNLLEDVKFNKLLLSNGIEHRYKLHPNSWMKAFGISSEEEVRRINGEILLDLRIREMEHEATRVKEGWKVMGSKGLRLEPIMKEHTPKKGERSIFIICADKDKRIEYIEKFKALSEECRKHYEDLKLGVRVRWPAGMFRPSIGTQSSALGWL